MPGAGFWIFIFFLRQFIVITAFMEPTIPYEPEFLEPIVNASVPLGRDTMLSCLVMNLGGYRVGWVKTETKAIQAIHEHVITHNSRVWVSHNDQTTWNLHIKNVREEDRGEYMCQINTDPMKSQTGYLDVVTPPDIVYGETSGDIMVSEGGSTSLVCKAKGHPTPHITWKREDNEELFRKDENGVKERVAAHDGEILRLMKITRHEMGAYLCIASNGVPPSVSKRIHVSVHFHPVIHAPNQLVGAPIGTDVMLECIVEAFPKPITFWIREPGEMIATNDKYVTNTSYKSQFETIMKMEVKNFKSTDAGTYKCNAKNSVGDFESNIRIYEIPGSAKSVNQTKVNKMEQAEVYDSKQHTYKESSKNNSTDYASNLSNAAKILPFNILMLMFLFFHQLG